MMTIIEMTTEQLTAALPQFTESPFSVYRRSIATEQWHYNEMIIHAN